MLEKTETPLNEHFMQIRAESRANLLMHVGLKEHMPLLIDFSLIKYLIDKYVSLDIRFNALRTCVVFPFTSTVNVAYKDIASKINLSLGNRFMINQVYKIKLLRQSTSSAVAHARLDQMKNISKGLKNRCFSFWTTDDSSYSSITRLEQDIQICNNGWIETIKNFPNSVIVREEFSEYLIDVPTDFHEACKQQYMRDLLDAGKNMTVDQCFKSFVRCEPAYLKRKILDCKGNMIVHNEKKGTSTSSSKHTSETFSSSFNDKLEESIGVLYIRQAKLRIALQNALNDRKPNNLFNLNICIIVNLILGFATFITLYIVFIDFLNSKFQGNLRNTYSNGLQVNYLLGILYAFCGWGNQSTPQRFDPALSLYNIKEPVSYKSLWNGENLFVSMFKSSYTSRESYRDMISSIAQMSIDGTNVYEITGPLLEQTVNMPICANNKVPDTRKENVKNFFIGVVSSLNLMPGNGTFNTWWQSNDYFCDVYATYSALSDSVTAMRFSLLNGEIADTDSIKDILKYTLLSIPICVGLLQVVPFSVFFVLTIYETKKLIKLMTGITAEQKIDASKTLKKNGDEETDHLESTTKAHGSNASTAITVVVCYLLLAVEIVLIDLILLQIQSLNTKFGYMCHWALKSSLREASILEIALNVMECFVINGTSPVTQDMLNYTSRLERIEYLQGRLLIDSNSMNTDNQETGVRSILGYDEGIDELLIQSNCESNDNGLMHDMYACGSINQQISYFDNLVTTVLSKFPNSDSTMNGDIAMNLFHLTVAHLVPQLLSLDKMLTNLMTKFNTQFNTIFITIFVIGIAVDIVFLFLSMLLNHMLLMPYCGALTLLRRVHPYGIVNNVKLLDYLLGRNSEKSEAEMNITRAIIHNASDSIFLISYSGTIENINISTTKTFGYTPEQLLGQHFNSLFIEEEREKINMQLQFMLNKQATPSFDDRFDIVSDSGQFIPCYLMLFGMDSNGSQSGDISCFVALLRDETELTQHQKEAEEAKKMSEDLLYQILPRDIVIRINQGEKDISFEVASASIMFIDIVKFSLFSADLTPSQIMGTLSSIFGGFDELLAKYPLITKIKLIGDVYMCAAGLFTPDELPQHHAEQTLRFGLDALQVIDDMNMKMTTNLSVRIGLNSGGPLIAGVFGTEKPVFDIIGDPINIAARLQSTDIPNRVQISQSTYDLINGMDFNVENRGEIFLKGKGKTNTFLVKPLDLVMSTRDILL